MTSVHLLLSFSLTRHYVTVTDVDGVDGLLWYLGILIFQLANPLCAHIASGASCLHPASQCFFIDAVRRRT